MPSFLTKIYAVFLQHDGAGIEVVAADLALVYGVIHNVVDDQDLSIGQLHPAGVSGIRRGRKSYADLPGTAGTLGKDNLIHEERSAAMTGIGLKVQPEETFSTLQGKYGTASFAPTRFRCVIDDAEATIAGTWQDGAPAIGERRFPDYTSVVCGLPFLNAGILRNILSLNGLRFYNSGRSGLAQCSFSGPVLSLFSRQGGKQTIRLPREAEIVVDLFTGEVYGENISTFRFTMPPRPSTAVIFAGRREDYRKHLKVFPHPDAVHGN